MLFESIEEAEFRLNDGVMLWNGLLFSPRGIGVVAGEMLFYGLRVGTDAHISRAMMSGGEAEAAADGRPFLSEDKSVLIAGVTDPGFNEFEPFPIGYVYYDSLPMYCQRMPTRLVSQGLTRSALVFSRLRLSLSEDPSLIFGNSGISFSDLRPAIEGEFFVPAEKVCESLTEGREFVTVSHEVGVMRMSSEAALVFYEGLSVGSIDMTGPPDVVMQPSLSFLKSELMECGFGIKE